MASLSETSLDVADLHLQVSKPRYVKEMNHYIDTSGIRLSLSFKNT